MTMTLCKVSVESGHIPNPTPPSSPPSPHPQGLLPTLGDGHCQQSDGQLGVLAWTTLDDAGCIIETEYDQMWSVASLSTSA